MPVFHAPRSLLSMFMTCPEWDVSSPARVARVASHSYSAAPPPPGRCWPLLSWPPLRPRHPANAPRKVKISSNFSVSGHTAAVREQGRYIVTNIVTQFYIAPLTLTNPMNYIDKWRKRIKTKCQNIHGKALAGLDIITRYFQHVTMWWWTTVTDWRMRTPEPALIHHHGFLFSVQNFGLVSSIVRPENSRTLSTHLKSSSWPHILLIFQSFYVK